MIFRSIAHIMIATGLPAPLDDVPQGRHFFMRRYFMNEIKPHLSYEGQIDKLREKGCVITDDSFCKNVLVNIGYYRTCRYRGRPSGSFPQCGRGIYRQGESWPKHFQRCGQGPLPCKRKWQKWLRFLLTN